MKGKHIGEVFPVKTMKALGEGEIQLRTFLTSE
jgi:hypothetical protein